MERQRTATRSFTSSWSRQVVLAVLTAAVVVFAYERLDGNIANGEAIAHIAEKPEYEGEREPAQHPGHGVGLA